LKKIIIAILALTLILGLATVAHASALPCDHPTTTTVTHQPTCEQAGYIETTCTVCGVIIPKNSGKPEADTTSTDGAPALGHVFGATTTTTEATCISDGTGTKTCTRCGKTVNVTLAPSGHKYSKDPVVKEEPTCTHDGVYKYQCSLCGDIKPEVKAKTNTHKFGDKSNWDVDTQGTCVTDGTYKAKCLMCGVAFTYDPSVKGTEVLKIAARGHKLNTVITLKPTCQLPGKKDEVCTNRGTIEYKACDYAQKDIAIPNTIERYNSDVQMVTNIYHQWKEIVEVAPTNGAWGIHRYECTVAGCGMKTQELAYKGAVAHTDGTEQTGIITTGGNKASGNKTSGSSGNTSSGTGNKASTNSKGVTIPATGDNTNNLPFVMIAVAFAGIAALVISKRKVNG